MRPAACWPAARLESVGAKNTDGADHLGRPAVHSCRTLRGRGSEHHAPQQAGTDQRDLLRHKAADGKAEQIDSLKAHRLNEVDRIVSVIDYPADELAPDDDIQVFGEEKRTSITLLPRV